MEGEYKRRHRRRRRRRRSRLVTSHLISYATNRMVYHIQQRVVRSWRFSAIKAQMRGFGVRKAVHTDLGKGSEW